MAKEYNKDKKTTYVEKVLYRQNYYVDDTAKRRQLVIKRSNNNLIIAGNRWNTQYNSYSLIPNTKLSAGYNDGILYLIDLLDQGLLKLQDLVIDENMYDSDVFSLDVSNARDEKFEIVVKVNKSGLAYLLFQVTSGGNKDIIPIEEKDLVSEGEIQAQPFYIREIQNLRDKLYNFAYDMEAQDKFNFKMVSANKEEKEIKKEESKEENGKVDDFVF